MAGPIPCAGHPSRAAAVVAMLRQGHELGAIATALGLPRTVVAAGLLNATKATRRISGSAALAEAAAARGISPRQIADRLLRVLAADPALIDAVLDDRPAAATPDRTGASHAG